MFSTNPVNWNESLKNLCFQAQEGVCHVTQCRRPQLNHNTTRQLFHQNQKHDVMTESIAEDLPRWIYDFRSRDDNLQGGHEHCTDE